MQLSGFNILLVEDEPLIALDLTDTLEAAGARVIGPIRSLKSAFDALEDRSGSDCWDAVVLDYRLTDGTSQPFAEALKRADVPFLIHSGNAEILESLAIRLSAPLLAKPSDGSALVDAIARVVRLSAEED